MTFRRSTLVVVLGVVGAFGAGLAVGQRISAKDGAVVASVEAPAVATAIAPAAVEPAPAGRSAARLERVPTASAEPVQKQVKRLLNRGADVQKASEGFPNAYQFMMVAYAAKNTDIPFAVLKHRVLTERKSLATAIAEFKPELDEAAEADRARAEARADLSRIPI